MYRLDGDRSVNVLWRVYQKRGVIPDGVVIGGCVAVQWRLPEDTVGHHDVPLYVRLGKF